MKKILMTLVVIAAFACVARPGPHYRPHHHYHHHSVWGHGGRYFWPGFTGGLVGSLVAPYVAPPPPPPVVMVNPVWVPPVYGSRPVYDIYGRIIRYEQYVVTPGYWR